MNDKSSEATKKIEKKFQELLTIIENDMMNCTYTHDVWALKNILTYCKGDVAFKVAQKYTTGPNYKYSIHFESVDTYLTLPEQEKFTAIQEVFMERKRVERADGIISQMDEIIERVK